MHFAEFQTETRRFSNWDVRAYWFAVCLVAGLGLVWIFQWLDPFDLEGVSHWIVLALIGAVWLIVCAAVAVGVFLYLIVYQESFGAPAFRGLTRARADGSIVVESTRDGRELARCVPGCKKSIVVGMGRLGQAASCAARPVNSEPVSACLYCADTIGDGSAWIDLFDMTHDGRDVVVNVNDAEIRFPYHGHPDYVKIARRVAHSCPAFGELEVRDASEK